MGMKKTLDCTERAFSRHKELNNNLPCILHQTIQHTPAHFSVVIKWFLENQLMYVIVLTTCQYLNPNLETQQIQVMISPLTFL